jgi:hypothetical protein
MATFPAQSVVTLTATPAAGSVFAGWSGGFAGTTASRTMTLTNNVSVTARFDIQDTIPPVVAITAPVLGATVAGNVTVTAAATDNFGVAGVQFTVDGANIGAEVLAAPFAVTWKTTMVPNGPHALRAVARDAGGNTTTSAPITVGVKNSDLVLHFNFETNFSNGIVRDVSGYANHGLRYSLTRWPVDAAGVSGRGAYFPGKLSPAYIAVTNWNGIDVLTNGSISIWAKFSANSYDGSTLLDAGDVGHPNSWRLGRDQSSSVKFLVFDPAGAQQVKVVFPDDVIYSGVTPTFATATWHNYAVAWDGNNIVGYYDGSPISTNTMGVPFLQITAGGHWMAVGCRQRDGTPQWGDDSYPSSGWFGGTMDEVRMYSRALSRDDIQTIFLNPVYDGRPPAPSGVRIAGP